MDLPIATAVDSKEHLRFRAMCDERISFPFEELREFPDVYSKLAPFVAADSFVEVKVAWRYNTEQWWCPLKLTHSTRSWAALMLPFVLLAWIRRVLWAHLTSAALVMPL